MLYKTEYKLDYFNECSAKSGDRTKDVFIEATKLLYSDYLLYRNTRNGSFMSNSSSFRNKGETIPRSIAEKPHSEKKKGCC